MKQVSVILILCFLAFNGCKKNSNIETSVTDHRSVSDYSPHEITVKEEFFVRFVKDYISEEDINSEVSSDIFEIRPAVKGKAFWQDQRTIIFKPETQWAYNEQYKAFIDTDKMFGTGKRSMISFMTNPVIASLISGQMELDSNSEEANQIVRGYVSLNDEVSNETVEQTLEINQKGNPDLSIEWDHAHMGFKHNFIIKGIKRLEEDSELVIKCSNQGPITKFDSERRIVIPTKNNFSLLSAGLLDQEANYFEAVFSDPIDKSQNLDGLIRLKDSNATLKLDVSKNVLKIYPKPFPSNNTELIISQAIKSNNGKSLKQEHKVLINIIPSKPQVRFTSAGNIMPNVGSTIVAFEAKQLHAVDVEIFKVYENNVQEFFQYASINQVSNNRMVGNIVHSEKVILNELGAEAVGNGWSRYALNLDYFIDADPAAIYELRLGFKKSYANYECENNNIEILNPVGAESSIMVDYYNYKGFQYEHYEDPCYPAYYTARHFVRKNILVSNLALVAKSVKDKRINIYASDLRTASPLSGVQLNLYTLDKQLLGTVTTDSQGMAEYDNTENVFFVTGIHGREYAYLSTFYNRTVKTSHFDVGGVNYKNGFNGFIYGERGVWRPGDTIFLSLMLENNEVELPQGHPVVMKVYNAKGELHDTQTKIDNIDGLYVFNIKTESSSPTGNWRAEAKVGNQVFRKTLKVETIRPNRLKINLDRANDSIYNVATEKIKVESKWLHGSPSSDLKVKVEANYVSVKPTFKGFDDFVFNDPARKINTSNTVVHEGKLNEDGVAGFKFKFGKSERFPGNIRANLNTRVFEKSGSYSNYYSHNIIFPFESYAGVKLPKSRWGRNYVSSKTGTQIDFVNLDNKGKPKANNKLKVGIYDSYWSWWYNRSDRDIYKYNSDSHYGAIDTFTVVTNSKGEAVYNSDFGDTYGNYLIRVCDTESGHCSGQLFYTGRWGGSSEQESSMSSLNIKKNASSYQVGEEVIVNFPTSEGANVLISIESSTGVIKSEWIPAQGEQTEYRFKATAAMAPNIYINVSMIQVWERENDLPLRMYGVIPIEIKDPNTELKPVIESAEVFAPNSKVNVKVSEEQGKAMAYTIAMVDEGLLDLTNFKTPDPHKHFFAKQALNVQTWDLYDFVMNKHGGEIEKIISIGGDSENGESSSKANANRFKAVVHFSGPHYLEAGKMINHEIEVPNYMGSVKLMVVAKQGNKYGKMHKLVPVKKELMLLTTFPRVLTLGDQINIPVNTFWTEDYKTTVDLNMKTNDKVIPVRSTVSTNFEKQGDKISELVATTGDQEGIAEFKITGTAGRFSSYEEVEIDVRNPNPLESRVTDFALQAGESLSEVVDRFGVSGNQSAVLEVSRFPSLNIDDRLGYLIRYPHGCLEQTVSSAFPQLYLNTLMDLPDIQVKRINKNISAAIKKLESFNRSGQFNYWRGGSYYHGWSDVYAAHFLHVASDNGYYVGSNLLKSWKENHYAIANKFEVRNASPHQLDIQAYRLYVLAMMGNSNSSAMNRLRNVSKLTDRAIYLLAAAYGKMGQVSIGKDLIKQAGTDFKDHEYDYYSFSSSIRDEALAAITLRELGEMPTAVLMTKSIAEELQLNRWFSTHSLAFALLSIAQINTSSQTEVMDYNISINGSRDQAITSEKLIDVYDLALKDQASFSISNNSSGILYVSVINQGKEKPKIIQAKSDNLKISVEYLDENGTAIDHKILKQGTDFLMKVKVNNPGSASYNIEDLALTQIFPAGWEIRSGRLSNQQTDEEYQYRDVRDDRVSTFFEIRGRSSKTFTIKLNASYVGDFYLPPTTCESMYNNRIHASTASNRVKVIAK